MILSTLYLILFLGKNSHLLILSLSYDNEYRNLAGRMTHLVQSVTGNSFIF